MAQKRRNTWENIRTMSLPRPLKDTEAILFENCIIVVLYPKHGHRDVALHGIIPLETKGDYPRKILLT